MFSDGLPCRGGVVTVRGSNGYHAECATDEFGRFQSKAPGQDGVVEVTVVAPGTIPLEQHVDLGQLVRDDFGHRVLHLRALRRASIRVVVVVDPSMNALIDSSHRVRLTIVRPSLLSVDGFEAVRSSGAQTLPVLSTDWPITITASEDSLRGCRGWVVRCDLVSRRLSRWREVPIVFGGVGEEQSTASVRIVLDASTVLMGTVLSEDDLPLHLAQVEFKRPGSPLSLGYTEPDGRFLLPVTEDGDGTVLIRYGSVRVNLGVRSPGDDLGRLVVPVPECIRIRLVDADRHPIIDYLVGFSNARAVLGETRPELLEHPNGVALIRPRALSKGDRLFFEGRFGQMIYEIGADLHGGSVPIEVVAVPSSTGTLRVVGSLLASGNATVRLREDRTPRRFSANLSHLAVVDGQDGVCVLEDIAVGNYQYEIQLGGLKTAQGFVVIHEGQNELQIR